MTVIIKSTTIVLNRWETKTQSTVVEMDTLKLPLHMKQNFDWDLHQKDELYGLANAPEDCPEGIA